MDATTEIAHKVLLTRVRCRLPINLLGAGFIQHNRYQSLFKGPGHRHYSLVNNGQIEGGWISFTYHVIFPL